MSVLQHIHHVREAPVSAYLVYNLKGGLYYLLPRQYEAFIISIIGHPRLPPLAFDLSSLQQHALIFDLDLKLEEQPHSSAGVGDATYEWIESTFKNLFLQFIPHFTYILCTREGHGGIHIHLPEFTLAHDDYVLLCQSLQTSLSIPLDTGERYTLDVLQNSMLPGTIKPNTTSAYFPRKVVYVDRFRSQQLTVFDYQPANLEHARSQFKINKTNSDSFFLTLLRCSRNLFREEIKYALMPLSIRFKPVRKLSYPTIIGSEPAQAIHTVEVALLSYRNGDAVYILKDKTLDFKGKHLLLTYSYLKLNAPQILTIVTDNHAIRIWGKRFLEIHRERAESALQNIPERLHPIHHMLCKEHPCLSRLHNPLKSVMEYNDGYFFLPVFYALCRHFQASVSEAVEMVWTLVDDRFHPLLERLRSLAAHEIPFLPADVTLKTLHYCCNHMGEKPESMSAKLKDVVQDNRESILSMTTHNQIIEVVRGIQERHFPIQMLNLKNNLKKTNAYIWNFLTESWQELGNQTEVHSHITNLWSHIRSFLIDYGHAGGIGGPCEDVYEKLSVPQLTAMINSDISMERKEVQMDLHKWFLRLQHGTLDLLTGHIGGVVPEFYMSDRHMGLDFERARMIQLCDRSPLLESVYAQLVHPQFVLRFLKAVLVSAPSATFDGIARNLLWQVLPGVNAAPLQDLPLIRSMLLFYVNLCLYMSFECDMMHYLMDVMASTFIATNYERKFVVCKGVTKNGKSVLFDMLKAVFGGYFVGIQSENLMPVSQGNVATPELASSLFSARIVSCEELAGKLNENRVKQITGNSHVTFRNMYEQNGGGIPTAKVFANTNNYPDCKASMAFHDRTVAIPFDARFLPPSKTPKTIARQVRKGQYPISTGVTEQCFKGCFLMLYYHLKQRLDRRDGFLHLREEPPYVAEFTKDYLKFTDVYVQFKMFMDVQIVPGSVTNLSMLKSAVRQYLKAVRDVTTHDTDLLERFADEFKSFRKTQQQLSAPAYRSCLEGDDDEQEEGLRFTHPAFENGDEEWSMDSGPPNEAEDTAGDLGEGSRKRKSDGSKEGCSALKKRLSNANAMVFYENLAIKNLKNKL